MKKLKVFSILTVCLALGLALASCTSPADSIPPTYTITFNANGGSGTAPGQQKVQEGSGITLPNEGSLSRTGYTFGGWNTSASGTGTNYSAGSSYTPAGDITLYAKWNATCTITFNINGGTGTVPSPITASPGSSITLPDGGGLSRTGYTFGGWNTNEYGTETNYAAGFSYVPSGNITLYVRWDAVAVTYTITFNINGGSGTAPAAQTVSADTLITLPSGNGLTKTGYTFGGWNTNAAGTGSNYSAGSSYTAQGDITLYAFWNNSTVTYTVTFNVNGGNGTPPSAQTVQAGSSITLPDGGGLSKDGYTFGGWNTNTSGTGTDYAAGSSYTPSGDITLYAKWNITYTVTFNINGEIGTAPSAQTAQAGSSITLPSGSDLTRSGYTFGGWNTNASGTGTNYSAGSSYTVQGDITLYAFWNASTVTYTVSFNANGGSGTPPSAQTVQAGSSVTLPDGSGLSKTGYIFGGWNTNASDTGTDYAAGSSYTPTGDITLYAKWLSTVVPGTSLAAKLEWLQANALSGVDYTVEVNADESIAPHTLSYSGRSNITINLIGIDSNRNISLSSNGAMFAVGSGVTLVLDNNVTLRGRSNNTDSLVKVDGMLIMNDGSTITGNTASDNGGGGVGVGYGTFTMNGGEISGNTSDYSGGGVYVYGTFTMSGGSINNNGGGGVRNCATFIMKGGIISENMGAGVINEGTFTMEGGIISRNTGDYFGGGVSGGIFIMKDGTISENTAQEGGGGVHAANFTMNGGTISGNTASYGGGVGGWNGASFTMTGGEISGNTASASYGGGGGVYMSLSGTFTMNGGEISGNTSSSNDGGGGVYMSNATFTMTGGVISGNTSSSSNNGGGGVSVWGETFTMYGGEISGNTASSCGGGVYVGDGTFTMYGGTVYGSNESGYDANNVPLANTADTGAALYVESGTVTYGDNSNILPHTDEYTTYTNNTITGSGIALSGSGTEQNPWLVSNAGEWNQARANIIATTGNYFIHITENFNMTGSDSPTFGNTPDGSALTVTMSGDRTISLEVGSTGSLLRIGNNQAVIMQDVDLEGHADNTTSLTYVDYGSFTMQRNASVSGNGTGGGVYVGYGTFTMNGGEISGNTASYGGGVFVDSNGTFTKTNGTIYGYSENDTVNSNTVKDDSGTVQSNRGHAVYVNSDPVKRRETTAGPGVNLDSSVSGTAGGWEN